MNTPHRTPQPRSGKQDAARRQRTKPRIHPRKGVALLLVLSALVLLSVLVIGILGSARQEVSTSSSFSAGSEARLIADTAVNLVTAQIAKGTSNEDLAWISQPGLIRTFSQNGQQEAFKLYSSYQMVEGSGYDPAQATGTEVPTDWHSKPNEFVDLNRPVNVNGRLVYPIVDPSAYDPNPQTALVEGFTYDAASRAAPSGSAWENKLPMPVRWIYVTPSGEMVGAGDPKRSQATSRVAFWADDETSKVNINTASGGAFFDYPAVNTKSDHLLGQTQPIAQEYQRWPGHPATTSLTPVLKALRQLNSTQSAFEETTLITPRVGWGGSKGGTLPAWSLKGSGVDITGKTDMDRLFVSVDELAFGPKFVDGARELFKLSDGDPLDQPTRPVDALRFFLSAQSRAPELNLFNRPRISLWPFNHEMVSVGAATAEAAKLTPEDRLIRFASELGGVNGDGTLDLNARRRLYFQRKSAWVGTADYDDIPENRALYAYLQELTSKSLPSASSSRAGNNTFLAKYGQQNRDQILVQMWDYIRSNVNTMNESYEPVRTATASSDFSAVPYSFPRNHRTTGAGATDIAPLVVKSPGGGDDPRGFGRFPALTEVIAQFVNLGETLGTEDAHYNPDPTTTDPQLAGPDGLKDYVIRRVRMVLLLRFDMPINNLNHSMPRMQVRITGDKPFTFNTLPDELNPTLSEPIKMRRETAAGDGPWVTDLGEEGIGFPGPLNNTNFRQVNYVSAYSAGDAQTRGGDYGVYFGLLAPTSDSATAGNTANWWGSHTMKVLSNRTGTLFGEDKAKKDSFSSSREDVYYPFVSDVIEFRLPQNHFYRSTDPDVTYPKYSPPLNTTTIPNKIEEDFIPGATFAKAGNRHPGRYDFFQVRLEGTSLKIEIFPGLKDGTPKISSIDTNWQDIRGIQPLLETTLAFKTVDVPLPRLGPDTGPKSGQKYVTNGQSNTTFYALQDYYKRVHFDSPAIVATPPDPKGSNPNKDPLIPMMDSFRSYVLTGDAPLYGDVRVAALRSTYPSLWWVPYPTGEIVGNFHGMSYFAKSQQPGGTSGDPMERNVLTVDGSESSDPMYAQRRQGRLHADIADFQNGTTRTALPLAKSTRRSGSTRVGDFSLGFGGSPAGALVVGPDVGAMSATAFTTSNLGVRNGPYYAGNPSRGNSNDEDTNRNNRNYQGLLFSPFKQVASPVIFGTLPSRPTGLDPGSWETLLFNPNPAGGRNNHRGWTQLPRDHYFLDLFYSPVVEPYAITENFATAGKVNLNYQIAPFTYIKRKTAMHAVLESFTARARATTAAGAVEGAVVAATLDQGKTTAWKMQDSHPQAANLRTFVGVDETLAQFDGRFAANDPFVSASEICEISLIPPGMDQTWWDDKVMSGDDKLESPYNHIYPRVTTRSNTFRVHFWAQTLNPKGSATTPRVTGEYRGSTVVERYLDPNLKEYAANFPALNKHYLFRKVDHHQFAP